MDTQVARWKIATDLKQYTSFRFFFIIFGGHFGQQRAEPFVQIR